MRNDIEAAESRLKDAHNEVWAAIVYLSKYHMDSPQFYKLLSGIDVLLEDLGTELYKVEGDEEEDDG